MSKYAQTAFKVMMHGNIYVDVSLLYTGIYETNVPRLYSYYVTIESLISQCEDLLKNNFIDKDMFNAYKENISKCRLASAYLEIYEN